MTFRLFDAPLQEPSHFVGFAGNRLNRASEGRGDDCVEKALDHASARLLLMGGGWSLLKLTDGAFDPYFTTGEARKLGAALGKSIVLGFDEEVPILAAPLVLEPDQLPDRIKAIDFRSIYTQGLVDAPALGALAQGASLLAWHVSHRFCGKCGGEAEMRAGGYKRLCTACGSEHFPRSDPVAIMLTVTRDRCLLGRGSHFAPGMYSALAGFIEPGETIENAVRRETFEEAGIRLGRVLYQASQPWPFPYSLMIGCFGEALNEDIHVDRNELEDCRWFVRDEVLAMLAKTHPTQSVPPEGAIAHHLIKAWATGV